MVASILQQSRSVDMVQVAVPLERFLLITRDIFQPRGITPLAFMRNRLAAAGVVVDQAPLLRLLLQAVQQQYQWV
jgi:hypothetical protein